MHFLCSSRLFIIRQHRMHICLLRSIATDDPVALCQSVCLSRACAVQKTKRIEELFGLTQSTLY